MSLTTVADSVLNPDDSPRVGTITFIPTQTAMSGSGVVPASSTVSATLNGSGAFSVQLKPSSEYDRTTYYQAWFKGTAQQNREYLGLYEVPVSTATQTLGVMEITDTDLITRYKFASEAGLSRLVSAVYDEDLAAVMHRVQAYGGAGDAIEKVNAGTMSATFYTLTTGAATFTADDVGKAIYVIGAGASGTMLKSTIAQVNSATSVDLDDPCVTSIVGKTFYFGTDNTTPFADAIAAVNALGGGIVTGESGNYIVDTIELEKRITLKGTGIDCFEIWSAKASGQIIDSTWPINSSTAVDIDVEDLTVKALDPLNTVAGFADTGGTFVNLRRCKFTGTYYDVVFDQTEVSTIEKCRFEGFNVPYYGALIGSANPVSDYSEANSAALKWALTGSPAAAATDGLRWQLSVSAAEVYYKRNLASDAFKYGFTLITRGPEVSSGAQTLRVCNGSQRFDLVFTSTTVALNGGTARSILQSSYIRLEIARGGATADLKIDGSETDSDVAALSASTVNTGVIWGQIGSGTSNLFWNDFQYQAAHPLPAGLWIVSGDDWTATANPEWSNVLTVKDSQFNRVAIAIADDGGYGHFIENNNFNGTLHDLAIGSAYAVECCKNAFEGATWEPVRIGGIRLQRSQPAGSPDITIRGGHFNHGLQFGARSIDVKQAVQVNLDGLNFSAGATKPAAVRFAQTAVNAIHAKGVRTQGCDLITSLPTSDYTRFNIDDWDADNHEAHVHRQSSYKFRTIPQTLTGNGATTVNLSLGNNWLVTLTANATLTISNIDKVSEVIMKIAQDATGSRTITWPSSVKWVSGAAPTLTTAANSVDVVRFFSDGTNLYEMSRALDVK